MGDIVNTYAPSHKAPKHKSSDSTELHQSRGALLQLYGKVSKDDTANSQGYSRRASHSLPRSYAHSPELQHTDSRNNPVEPGYLSSPDNSLALRRSHSPESLRRLQDSHSHARHRCVMDLYANFQVADIRVSNCFYEVSGMKSALTMKICGTFLLLITR